MKMSRLKCNQTCQESVQENKREQVMEFKKRNIQLKNKDNFPETLLEQNIPQ
jgi:hypothetical protein